MLEILMRRKKKRYFKCVMQKASLKTRKKSVSYQLVTSPLKPPLDSYRTSEKINSFTHKEVDHIHRVLQFCQSFPYSKLSLKSTKPQCVVAQSCSTLCDPTDCSLPGFSVHGIFQATVLEWIAISFSRGSSQNQGSNPGLLLCRQTLYHLSQQGSLQNHK